MFEHRWSGWPGAWCLDCGVADPFEECLAHDKLSCICSKCNESWPQGNCSAGGEHEVVTQACEEHLPTECTEPNSHNHDPYWKGLN
jgi:hypothetical protein